MKPRIVPTTDAEIVALIDNRQLRGRVVCNTPGRFVAYVPADALVKWRAANSAEASHGSR
jgi:hypothetical protein